MEPWNIEWLELVDSTNSELKRRPDAPHGAALASLCQTGGRGRLGRSFLSPAGGLYLSVALRIGTPPLHLTPLVALAVRQAVAEVCGLAPQIKWINDLVLQQRKVCGILTEFSQGMTIVGIGLNCNNDPAAFPPEVRDIATSLQAVLGRPVDIPALAGAIVRQVQAIEFRDPGWRARYAACCITLGKQVQVLRGDTCRRALAEDIDPQGALMVRYEDGSREAVASGEVSVRGLYGYLTTSKENAT